MTFEEVSRINLARCSEWHEAQTEEWKMNDWAAAMAGEAGEVWKL